MCSGGSSRNGQDSLPRPAPHSSKPKSTCGSALASQPPPSHSSFSLLPSPMFPRPSRASIPGKRRKSGWSLILHPSPVPTPCTQEASVTTPGCGRSFLALLKPRRKMAGARSPQASDGRMRPWPVGGRPQAGARSLGSPHFPQPKPLPATLAATRTSTEARAAGTGAGCSRQRPHRCCGTPREAQAAPAQRPWPIQP